MYIDKNLLFADTLTTTTSGAATDYLDSTAASIKLGDGYSHPLFWVVKTEAAFAGGAACTATFQLQTANDASFTDGCVTLAATDAFLTAALTINTVMARIRVPLGIKRYTRVYMVVGGTGVFTTVSYSSFLTPEADNNLP